LRQPCYGGIGQEKEGYWIGMSHRSWVASLV
jgi:hypothetical protein